MRVLVACEFSGVVRRAFRERGHKAFSVDVLPAEDGSKKHIVEFLDAESLPRLLKTLRIDLLIAHPPCTYLSVSGMHWNQRATHWRGQPHKLLRHRTNGDVETEKALQFFRLFLEADVPKVCVENPISVVSSRIAKPTQIIQPFHFGHRDSKKTCLWLRGLPQLIPTKVEKLKKGEWWDNQTKSGQNKLGPSETRGLVRSITYQGIADAFASQWGPERES